MRKLLSIPQVRLFYLGDTASALGDYALWLAVGIWVREISGSTSAAALVMFVYTFGVAFSPLSGVVADRFRRKPLLIVSYLATAAVLTALTAVHDRRQVWIVYAVMFLYGLSGSITGPAQAALIPDLVGRELIGDANGLQQSLRTGLRLIAPALGAGVLATLGGGAMALVDAATFVVAAACLAAIPIREDKPERVGRRTGAALAEGLRFLFGTALLRQLTIACVAALLVMGFSTALGFAVATSVLHRSASFVAVIITVQGVGALIGGPTAAPLMRRVGERNLVACALLLAALASLLRAVPDAAVVLAANMVMGAAVPWLLVGAVTAMQRATPRELLGRVAGAGALASAVPQTAGQAVGAALIAVVAYRTLCFIVAGVLLAVVVYLAGCAIHERSDRNRAHEAELRAMTTS